MRVAALARLKCLERCGQSSKAIVRLRSNSAYLKLLPSKYSGPRYRVKVGQRPDGRYECEKRPGPPPRNHAEKQDPNVRIIYEPLSDGLAGQSTAMLLPEN
jgi:hypothetical protein